MNVIITLVAWISIIPQDLADEPWDTVGDVLTRLNIIIIHVIPLIFNTINMFVLSDMIVYVQDLWIVPLVAAIYLTMAYFYTDVPNEKWIYDFLTFDDPNSLYFAIGVVTFGYMIHFTDAFLTQALHGRFELNYLWWEL